MASRGWLGLLGAALLLAGGAVAARRFLSDSPPRAGSSDSSRAPAGSAPREPLPEPADASSALPGEEPARPTRIDAARPDATVAERGPPVRVHVADGQGRSLAGIAVALQLLGGRRPIDGREPLSIARTDDAGLATLGGVDRRFDTGEKGRYCVAFAFPTAGPRFVAVDPFHPPEHPVELIAPELGRVTVELVDPGGAPVRSTGWLELSTWTLGDDPEKGVIRGPTTAPTQVDGRFVVDPIGVGLRLHVEATLAELAAGIVEGDGPQHGGESATLRLVFPRRGPVVVGRLVLPDGTPAAARGLHGAARTLHGILSDDPDRRARYGDVAVTPDADGRFRFDASKYEIDDPDAPRWLDLLDRDDVDGLRGRARAKMPAPFAEGDHDVGDVVFEVAPLVVSGRVIDEQGAAVPGTQICLCEPGVAASEWIRAGGSGAIAFGKGDEQGRFAIHDFVDPTQRLVFAIDGRKRESVPARFDPGESGVTLILRGFGAIVGSLVMDPAIDTMHVGLFLRRADGGESAAPFELRIAPTRDGSFQWTRVVAGRVDVAVAVGRSGDEPETIAIVRDVEVKEGKACADPRLSGIDVAAHMKRIHVELVDAEGAPIPEATVTLFTADERHLPLCSVVVTGGAAELPSLHETIDLEAYAPGLAVARRFGVTSPVRIVLRQGFPVQVALEPPLDPKLASPNVSFRLTLTPDPPRETKGYGQQRVELEADGSGTLALAEAGRFQAELEAICDLDAVAGREPTSPRFVEAKTRWLQLREQLDAAFGVAIIEIVESPDEQQARVPLPAAARAVIDEMLRGFRGS